MKIRQIKSLALFLKFAGRSKKVFLSLTFIYIASTVVLVLAPRTLSRFIDTVYGGGGLYAAALAILLYLAAMLTQSAMAAVLDYRLA